jgi:hypothetical protein
MHGIKAGLKNPMGAAKCPLPTRKVKKLRWHIAVRKLIWMVEYAMGLPPKQED